MLAIGSSAASAQNLSAQNVSGLNVPAAVKSLDVDQEVVIDGNIITSRGPVLYRWACSSNLRSAPVWRRSPRRGAGGC